MKGILAEECHDQTCVLEEKSVVEALKMITKRRNQRERERKERDNELIGGCCIEIFGSES